MPASPFIDPCIDAAPPRGGGQIRARSSAVEHYVDIVGVTSSNLVVPTIASLAGQVTTTPRKGRHSFKAPRAAKRRRPMKVRNSLRSLKQRHRDCQVVRRKGRVYVINKTQKKYKARQG